MESKHLLIAAAVTGAAVVVGVSLNYATLGPAGDTSSAPIPDQNRTLEKCFGIAKAGENGCQSGTHACNGFSTEDFNGQDWKLADSGTCSQLGGRFEAFDGINPLPST